MSKPEEKKVDPTKSGPVTVTATQRGTYPSDVTRQPGATFTIAHMGHFSKRWMAQMDSEAAAKFHQDVQNRREIDHLTGERVASGGVHEALAIALEENRDLKKQVAELEAELAAQQAEREGRAEAEAEAARAETGLEEGDFGDEPELDLDDEKVDAEGDVDDTAEAGSTPTRRRRRTPS